MHQMHALYAAGAAGTAPGESRGAGHPRRGVKGAAFLNGTRVAAAAEAAKHARMHAFFVRMHA